MPIIEQFSAQRAAMLPASSTLNASRNPFPAPFLQQIRSAVAE
jgi:hypothetical protein